MDSSQIDLDAVDIDIIGDDFVVPEPDPNQLKQLNKKEPEDVIIDTEAMNAEYLKEEQIINDSLDVGVSTELITEIQDIPKSDAKGSHKDWVVLPKYVLDIFNDGKSIPPAFPDSNFYRSLEDKMVEYYGLGWKCIPVRIELVRGRKLPNFAGHWSNQVLDLDHQLARLRLFSKINRIDHLPANGLAILTGEDSSLLVLDLDYKEAKDGKDEKYPRTAYKYLEKYGIKIYEDAYTVITQSKGHQIYFKYDPILNDVPTTFAKFFGDDSPVDFRGKGGLVFAVPSQVWVRGEKVKPQYTLMRGTLPLQGIPSALHSMIMARVADYTANSVVNIEKCTKAYSEIDSSDKSKIQDRLATNNTAPDRSAHIFPTLCMMINAGLKKDECWELVKDLDMFVERGAHASSRFEHMFNGAAGSVNIRKFDYKKSKASKIEVVDAVKEDEISKRVKAKATAKFNTAPIDWLVPGYFARKQVSMICARSNTGKTVNVFDLIRSIRFGRSIFGEAIAPVDPKTFLYVMGDYSENKTYNTYVKSFFPDDGDSSKNYICTSTEGILLDTAEGKLYLEKYLEEYKPDLIVLDSLSSVMMGVECDFKEAQDIKRMMAYVKGLAEKFNCHFLLIHHPRKSSNKDSGADISLDDIAGSMVFASQSDIVLMFNNVVDELGEVLKKQGRVTLAKNGDGQQALTGWTYKIRNELDDQGRNICVLDYKDYEETDETDTDKLGNKIVCSCTPEGVPTRDLKTLVGVPIISYSSYNKKISFLKANKIIKVYGEYRNQMVYLTDKGVDLKGELTSKYEMEKIPMSIEEDIETAMHRFAVLIGLCPGFNFGKELVYKDCTMKAIKTNMKAALDSEVIEDLNTLEDKIFDETFESLLKKDYITLTDNSLFAVTDKGKHFVDIIILNQEKLCSHKPS